MCRLRVQSVADIIGAHESGVESLDGGSSSLDSVRSDRIVLYSSLSEIDRIKKASTPYRTNGLLLVSTTLSFAVYQAIFGAVPDSNTLLILGFCVMSSSSFLFSIRFPTAYRFFLSSLMYAVTGITAIASDAVLGEAAFDNTVGILFLISCALQWYVADKLNQLHSPQVYLMKQQE
jgi:hypothetical protein